MSLQLTSSAFDAGGDIPSVHTCDGENISPPLEISDVPEAADSLVLIMDDPDVPESIDVYVWDHWIVFNIPAKNQKIPEGVEPDGIHGTGTGDNRDYYGPCPPDGEHRYFFKLFALDTKLDLAEGVSKVEVEQAMEGHVLESTELMGRYDRG